MLRKRKELIQGYCFLKHVVHKGCPILAKVGVLNGGFCNYARSGRGRLEQGANMGDGKLRICLAQILQLVGTQELNIVSHEAYDSQVQIKLSGIQTNGATDWTSQVFSSNVFGSSTHVLFEVGLQHGVGDVGHFLGIL